jgi:hypothetical protein
MNSIDFMEKAEEKITITGYLDRISRIALYFKND